MHKKFAAIPLFLALVLSCSKEPADNTPVVEFNMENPEVTNYIDYVYAHPYTVSDFTATYIGDYYQKPGTDGYRGDCPASFKVSWDAEPAAKSYTVVLSENRNLSNPERTVSLAANATEYSVTNLIPGHRYYCSVSANIDGGKSTEVYLKKINVKGRRRMIAMESTGNFRDLGGLVTESGKHVKYGQIFRGARCSAQGVTISDSDKAELRRIGIKADLDLRQDTAEKLGTEVYKNRKSPLGDDVDWKLFPKANESYFGLLQANTQYIEAMQWLINELKAGKPVYFHCKTGADRTGTLGWLIETLLGVTEVEKSIDFELTSFFYENWDGASYAFRSRNVAKNDNTKYDWGAMYKVINGNYAGKTISDKVCDYFKTGVPPKYEVYIPKEDIEWFRKYMLE